MNFFYMIFKVPDNAGTPHPDSNPPTIKRGECEGLLAFRLHARKLWQKRCWACNRPWSGCRSFGTEFSFFWKPVEKISIENSATNVVWSQTKVFKINCNLSGYRNVWVLIWPFNAFSICGYSLHHSTFYSCCCTRLLCTGRLGLQLGVYLLTSFPSLNVLW